MKLCCLRVVAVTLAVLSTGCGRDRSASGGHLYLADAVDPGSWSASPLDVPHSDMRLDARALSTWRLEGIEVVELEADTLVLRCRPGGVLRSPKGFWLDADRVDEMMFRFDSDGSPDAAFRLIWSGTNGRGACTLFDPRPGRTDLRTKLTRRRSWGGRIESITIAPTVGSESIVRLRGLEFGGQLADLARVGAGWSEVRLGPDFRMAFHATLPARCSLPLDVQPDARMHLGLACLGAVSSTTFEIHAVDSAGRHLIAEDVVRPEERWKDVVVSLGAFGGREVTLELSARASSTENPAVACWSDPVVRWGPPAGPNVFLYVVDTLRADHTEPYASGRAATPTLQRLARESVVFERCVAQGNWTKPSVTSLMTSTHLSEHGVSYWRDKLGTDMPTLAEILRDHGYRTACFSTNRVAGHGAGLERGFSYLFDSSLTEVSAQDTHRTLPANVLPWIERHRDEPLFVYVHTSEPHYPYEPPDRVQVPSDYAGTVDGTNYPDLASTPEEVRHVVSLYDGEVQHMDSSLGEFLRGLETLGLFDSSFFVLTSDHGEAFLEHGAWRHRVGLYYHQVDVPLILRLPAARRAGERVEEVARLIDVMPTLLSALDIRSPASVRGRDLFGGSASHPGFPVPGALTETTRGIGTPWTAAYQTASWKVELSLAADGTETVRVVETSVDPGEREPIAEPYPDLPRTIVDALRDWHRRHPPLVETGAPEDRSRDLEYVEELKALGYLGEDEED